MPESYWEVEERVIEVLDYLGDGSIPDLATRFKVSDQRLRERSKGRPPRHGGTNKKLDEAQEAAL
jgi:hypothetical protein